MPPMFWMARVLVLWVRRMASVQGTRGAPWPPTTMSAGRKLPTVGIPVRVARTEGSPSWRGDEIRDLRFEIWDGGRWQMVWPWLARAVIFWRSILAAVMQAFAAWANSWATMALSAQSSWVVVLAG